MTVILGLTGGIATGKSTVSNYLKTLGIQVIDADVGSRIIVKPGTDGLKKIVSHFGEDILNLDGTLDRKGLGKIVFDDKIQLEKLNSILEEHIKDWILNELFKCLEQNLSLVVLDIPLLYEKDYLSVVDLVMVVATTKEIQLKRLMERDSMTKKAAEARISTQLPIHDKVKKADKVIDNNDSIDYTKRQVYLWLKENKFI